MTLRIALISEHASPLATLGGVDGGGQNVYVDQVARRLAAMGYLVDVFTRRDAPGFRNACRWPRAFVSFTSRRTCRRRREGGDASPHGVLHDVVARFMARQPAGYDLVHANFFMSGLVAADLKTRTGLPFVVTFHALGRVRRQFQAGEDRFPDERFAIEDRIAREADQIIAECPQDEDDLIRLYHADPARVTVVPCGFDRHEFRPMSQRAARLGLGLDPAERILLQLGRLVPRKGVDNVIRAVGVLARDHDVRRAAADRRRHRPGARPVALCRSLLASRPLLQEEAVEDLVTFVGRRDRTELVDYYNAADVFVSTPWYEPFGITPLEAMACGTPVIGSNVGGIKFSVADGETGYLVPPNDPAALAERIAASTATRRCCRSSVARRSRASTRCSRGNGWSAASPRSTRTSSRRPPHRTASDDPVPH